MQHHHGAAFAGAIPERRTPMTTDTTPVRVEELRQMLSHVSQAYRGFKAPPGGWLREEFILRKGIAFTPQKLPSGYRRGQQKRCFTNAIGLLLAEPNELEYCEGFVLPPGLRS